MFFKYNKRETSICPGRDGGLDYMQFVVCKILQQSSLCFRRRPICEVSPKQVTNETPVDAACIYLTEQRCLGRAVYTMNQLL